MGQVTEPSIRSVSSLTAEWSVTIGWCVAALMGMAAVLVINGEPLFYFDTAGYLKQGESVFRILGLLQDPVGDLAGAASETGRNNDGMVIGNRSVIYAVILAAFAKTGLVWLAVVFQAVVLVATTWLIVAKAIQLFGLQCSAIRITAMSLFAASLGSAGFYIAFLMPDIFAPVLLLSMAAIVALAPVLRFWSNIALLVLGIGAVVVHPSHLVIAVIMLPICLLVGLVFRTGQLWRSIFLLALMPAVGIAQLTLLSIAVERATDDDLVYLPFVTARLISDGPGLTFLDQVCPNVDWATCALRAKLVRKEQLSPEKILFSKSEETGSFALLDPSLRKSISKEQSDFFRAVVLGQPIAVLRAAWGNTVEQLCLMSISMTIANSKMTESANRIYPDFPKSLGAGRLIADGPGWVDYLTRAHQALYQLSIMVILGLILVPQSRVPANLRAFAVVILLGIVANAFVTGAISQPADRYGARVAFLFPMLAVLLWTTRPSRPPQDAKG